MKKSRLKRKTPLKRGKSQLKRSRLRRRSKKRRKQEAQYRRKRKEWLEGRPCAICGFWEATDVHHMDGRENERLLDESKWLAVCRGCHQRIHHHPEWARKNGYLT